MKRRAGSVLVFGAVAYACASPASPAPPPAVGIRTEVSPDPQPPADRTQAAEAPAAPASDAGTSAEDPVIPAAPEKHAVDGVAAVVWVPENGAPYGFKSVLLEDSGGEPKVLGERKEPVFVGAKELWVLRTKKLATLVCDECELCNVDPPTCKKNRRTEIEEPFLKSLRSGKSVQPWRGRFVGRAGCKDRIEQNDTTLTLLGGVGSVYFASVDSWDQSCGAAHPMFQDENVFFDIDTGKGTSLGFPATPSPVLKQKAHLEFSADGACVSDPTEEPAEWRALAGYGPDGVLHGIYDYTVSAPYVCGGGPGHYAAVNEQVSDWIPAELETWGKLPGWVASYLKSSAASYAFMIPRARGVAAIREFKR